MKKNYLYGTLMLLLIACGLTLQHQWTKGDLFKKSALPKNRFSNADLKTGKLSENKSVPDSALATIYSSIAAREYHVTKDPATGIPQSPNRKQNLRAYYKPGTFTVKNRVDSAGHNFHLTLKTEGVYADSEKLFISKTDISTTISENKVQLKQGILTEEYINNEAGVRQNFIVSEAPTGTKNLEIRLRPEGLQVKDLHRNQLQFYSANDVEDAVEKLTYDGLKCWDANGKELPATLSYKEGLVQIAVNTTSATYPITIDPIVTSGNPANANAQLVGKQQEAQSGFAVASAGDVNGDGYSDVIVGAPLFDSSKPNQGAFFIYFGASSGLNTNGILVTGDNKVADAYFGSALSGAGDVNGDGFSDVVVGSWGYSNQDFEEGAAYIFYGSQAGINLTGTKIESDLFIARFGKSVASAGDINGDGFSDVIIGAPGFSNGENREGGAYIYLGSQTGISSLASYVLESNQSLSDYGSSVASAGDINGDGFSDVVVGAYKYDNAVETDLGAAFIYMGSASGMPSTPAVILLGQQQSAQFGYAVSTAGDLNGDGYSDVIIGSPNYTNGQNGEGAVSVYMASFGGLGISKTAKVLIEGGQSGGAFGRSVACAGDVNGDGFSDVIVGEPLRDNGANLKEGRAIVYFGSFSENLNLKSIISSSQAGAELGNSVASAGDVNGDGFSDVIVGAPLYDKNVTDDGIALVFHGSSASLEVNASMVILNAGADMGFSVSKAGDVNGDGFDDVIVGAPLYGNSANDEGAAFVYYSDENGVDLGTMLIVSMGQALANFGYSVAAAGDVNADGYDDVIIGAHQYNMAGLSDTGAGFVYYGSPSGLSLAITNVVYLPKASAHAGKSVSSAGDVNADGFDDVIVGVPFYDDGVQFNEGAFLISYGSKNGIKSGPGVVFEGNQTGEEMGNSVSSAGDINGDGYDDVVVGAYKFSNNPNTPEEGAAFVYYGNLYGLQSAPTLLELNNKTKSWTGWDVAGAGDINGDGFADVVIGSLYFNNGQSNEGAAAIFYGDATGIKTLNPIILEGNQTDALMGSSVSAADVNGDGYKDVLVGASGYTSGQSKEGAVFVYHGSETGLVTSPAAMIEVDEPGVQFGYSLSGAGDVNGDGFEDVIVGAPKFNAAGRGFVYHGNGPGIGTNFNYGLAIANLKLYNSDLTTNLNKDNLGKDDFGLGLFAKSFLGRNKGKLVWEIIGQGETFSHASPITNSTQFTGQGNLTDLQATAATELKSLVTKTAFLNKIRARVKFSPVLAITGQVYGPWRYENSSILADPSVLPVELIRFDAKAVEKQVNLTWETATEVNSDYFELQRSEDGKEWEQIGMVYSAGDSKKPNTYSFVDFKPQIGLNYYRMKMVDRDKTFAYSSIKAVTVEGKQTKVFPNPVSTTLNIESEIPNTEVVIYDVSGKEIMSHKNEKGIKSVDVSRLTPGGYLIKLGNKSFHMIKK
ncbi:FG-GAP-like repeat-containing protein [Dyadobacter sp. CY347]|uniref:FG-GAP-like repeat-containing protein n=1 Tax=Dyadobacter sp. CY347 TaxID=2909336 RepID=UPI001F180DB7|nr:FG-GAP-like repeat-containing protein [Dyadobacter sp. CY347]MCF2489865.1 FG-GAP-like repeat-containing protein [Dyadobacter sp. CY347]